MLYLIYYSIKHCVRYYKKPTDNLNLWKGTWVHSRQCLKQPAKRSDGSFFAFGCATSMSPREMKVKVLIIGLPGNSQVAGRLYREVLK